MRTRPRTRDASAASTASVPEPCSRLTSSGRVRKPDGDEQTAPDARGELVERRLAMAELDVEEVLLDQRIEVDGARVEQHLPPPREHRSALRYAVADDAAP